MFTTLTEHGGFVVTTWVLLYPRSMFYLFIIRLIQRRAQPKRTFPGIFVGKSSCLSSENCTMAEDASLGHYRGDVPMLDPVGQPL